MSGGSRAASTIGLATVWRPMAAVDGKVPMTPAPFGRAVRPELALVLWCARPQLDADHAAHVRALAGTALHWPDVLATALRHKLRPHLVAGLQAAGASRSVPDEWIQVLVEGTRARAVRCFALCREMLRLEGIFAAENLQAVPIRGPVLAWMAYGHIARRMYSRLHLLLVDPPQLARARQLLMQAGYGPLEASGASTESHGHFSPERNTRITLHVAPAGPDALVDEMRTRLRTLAIAGEPVRALSTEATLLQLCRAVARTGGGYISLLSDIAGVMARSDLDWDRTLRLADRVHRRRALLLGAGAAHDLLGVEMPEPIAQRVASEPGVPWLRHRVAEWLLATGGASPNLLSRLAFQMRVLDTWTARWRDVREHGLATVDRPNLSLAGFVPMREDVVEKLVEFAGPTATDVLYDLGCGDGRIVVSAARRYGIRGVGVDIDARRLDEARMAARTAGVEHLVEFIHADADIVDLRRATIVTLYMGADGVLCLAPGLKRRLRPGARMVSCTSDIAGWPWSEKTEVHSPDGATTPLYLWRISR